MEKVTLLEVVPELFIMHTPGIVIPLLQAQTCAHLSLAQPLPGKEQKYQNL